MSDVMSTNRPQLMEVDLDRLESDPEQPRRAIRCEGPQWQGLVASIRELGVLQQLIVRPHPTLPRRYIIISGERRWAAAQEAGLARVIVQVIRAPEQLAKLKRIQLAENALREGLSPLDELEAARALLAELDGSQVKLAQCLGVAESTVSGILKLDALLPVVRAAVRASGKEFSRRQLWKIAEQQGQEAQLAALDLLRATDPPRRGGKRARALPRYEWTLERPQAHPVTVQVRGAASRELAFAALRELARGEDPGEARCDAA